MAHLSRVRSRVARLHIPATSISNGRQSCKKWSLNGCFPSPGLILIPWTRRSTNRATTQKTQPRLSSQVGEDRNGHVACAHGVWFRQYSRRLGLEAFRRNEGGWAEQMKNIERYVAKAASQSGRQGESACTGLCRIGRR